MKLGDKVTRQPETFYEYDLKMEQKIRRPMPGRVVYVHPEGRYHTVEFMSRGGPIRESFSGV